jgi:hypothetical protein
LELLLSIKLVRRAAFFIGRNVENKNGDNDILDGIIGKDVEADVEVYPPPDGYGIRRANNSTNFLYRVDTF